MPITTAASDVGSGTIRAYANHMPFATTGGIGAHHLKRRCINQGKLIRILHRCHSVAAIRKEERRVRTRIGPEIDLTDNLCAYHVDENNVATGIVVASIFRR